MMLDHETRANRFLDAFRVTVDLLSHVAPGVEVSSCDLGQLMSLLQDEAVKVVTPWRSGANDDENDTA